MRILYATKSWSTHDQRFLDAWKDAGFEVRSISMNEVEPEFENSERFHDRLRTAIAEFAPDVVHAGPLSDVAPFVVSVWTGPLIAMSWGFDLLRDIERQPRVREAVAGVLRRADQVVVDNDAPALVALELGADASAIAQFPWGIDLEAFAPGRSALRSSLGWKSSNFVILSMRRHEAIYNVETVVRGFIRAAASAPQLRLLLAGSGSHTPALQALLEDAELEDRAVFLGEVRQPELPAVYRAADMYVSASVVDGSSVSLLEAMGTGIPTCVSDIAGNAQWIAGGRGLSFEVGDDGSLSELILSLVEDRAQGGDVSRSMARAAREFVAMNADWGKSGTKLAAIAAAAIERNRAHP